MANIVLKDVKKSFGSTDVIRGVDFEIKDKEFVVFVGPSGCGKSTLLRLIAGLEDITSGELVVDGETVNHLPPKERGVAMVFQSYALYPHMTVYENMAFGLQLAKESTDTIDSKVRKAADILELTPLLERLPKEMSGGQRQRVAIGRAIVRDPKVFLFDEPLSNLDASLRVQMRIEIAKLHEDMGATMIYVTHDQVEAMTLADKIVVLHAGNVEQVGGPLELYHHPANKFVAGFIGSPQMNFMDAKVVSASPTGVVVEIPGGAALEIPCDGAGVSAGDSVTFGIRPEHMTHGGASAPINGKVEVVEQLGESHFIYVRLPNNQLITVRNAGDALVQNRSDIAVNFELSDGHIFKADGTALRRLVEQSKAA
ncbi:MAG: sn-glycerol-3-phosphate ABC transporter ATP-binding protein UgpC [Hyphomicrobiales bacterium]